MTYTGYTQNILNIKDENVYFYENPIEIKKILETILKKGSELDDKNKFYSKNFRKNVSDYAKKCNKTLLEMEKYIVNAFDYDLCIVEGTNNVIKMVKHNACGYRLFNHLKSRIMLIKGCYNFAK